MSIAEKFEKIADEVYEVGKQDMNEAWWKAISGNYTRTNWESAFQYSDISNVGEPEQTINVSSVYRMFYAYKGASIPKNFNCSGFTTATHMARYAKITVFPDINIPALATYGGTWQSCTALETIEMVRCNEDTVFDAPFSDCPKLKNVTFEGEIGQNINFKDCKVLSRETLLSNGGNGVFGKLKDYEGTGTTRTITLHADTKEMLTEAEKAIATQKGWTIA